MRLALTHPRPVCSVSCCSCGERHLIGNVLADLDGEPFQAYYCRKCVRVQTRGEADDLFSLLGATHYHDSHYPGRRRLYDGYETPGGLFSRHYFNAEDMEIGLVIPDLFSVGCGVQVFETPRVWGIPHDLNPLTRP
jgi:hypothetical protein